MQVGVYIFSTPYAIGPVELGKRLEELGLESLWVPEHTHIPASRLSPWPGGPELPREYWHTLDPFLTLTAVATATERLRVATGVCLLIERDPITTAKEVSTLDLLSNGRFLFGIGGGWNKEEMANHGTDPSRRWKLLRERVEAMRAIWTQDEPEYHGELVDFDPLWQWPKPVQQPHPPVLLGSNAPQAVERVARYCDGWMPNIRRGLGDLEAQITELGRRCEELGRAKPSLTIWDPPAEQETLAELGRIGAERVILRLPPAGADEVLPLLDSYAELQRRFESA